MTDAHIHSKFDVSTFTHYEKSTKIQKAMQNIEIGVVLGS